MKDLKPMLHDLDDSTLDKVACLCLALKKGSASSLNKDSFLRMLGQGELLNFEQLQRFCSSLSAQDICEAASQIEEARACGLRPLSIFDPCYPACLREIYDPPLVFYCRGVLSQSSARAFSVAIVGARAASRLACEFASSIAEEIAAVGGSVISGLALGVDGAAHRGAMLGAAHADFTHPGVAVLGSGHLSIYPPMHAFLADELVAAGGALVSEYAPLVKPRKHHFPERNRIISGLSDFVLVVEASQRSGSLITARLALEQGRDVGAVPGAINNQKSSGSNELLAQGAVLVRSFADIVSAVPKIAAALRARAQDVRQGQEGEGAERQAGEFAQSSAERGVSSAASSALSSELFSEKERAVAKQLLAILDYEGYAQIDFFVEQSDLSFAEVQEVLAKLELLGEVVRAAGEFYERG